MKATLHILTCLVLATACILPARAGDEHKLAYPVAHRDATVDTYFGTRVPAPYQWMENLSDPALHRWVEAENRLTESYLSKIPLRGWIRHRLTRLWNHARESTPEQLKNGMLFFRRNSGLQNQGVLYVQNGPDAQARVLLDPNTLSPDGSIALAGSAPSPGGRYLAYALSRGGSDWRTLHVLDVATGKVLPDTVRWVKFSGIAWTHDGKGFFYARYPEPPHGEQAISHAVTHQKLYYHRLGTPQSADTLIYALPREPRAFIGASVSENGRYLYVFVQKGAISKNRLYYADLGKPDRPDVRARIRPLYPKENASYEPIGNIGSTLYLQTTLDAPRGRIVATRFDDPDPAHWRTVVPQAKGVLAGATMANGDILANYRLVAQSRLVLFDTRGKRLRTLHLPTLGSVSGLSARNDSSTAYYAFSSFLYPTTIYRYNVARGTTKVTFRPKVDFDPDAYQTRQVFYRSKDGTRVPMFIVARKDIRLDGSHPTVLYGYGGFDITITPRFNPMLPVWLELGGVYAVPNLRGGGVYGEAWHHAGMLGRKQNVFDDFAWAAKYLIRHGYTRSSRLAIQGYSNGGLLVGASITQRPTLFGAAYIGHGVLDMLRYQKFSGGAFWVPEYGSSASRKAFQWLIRYSPLHNIHPGTCYPPTFISTSWDDDRVVPSHEFKFTARLQRAQGCSNPILLRTTGSTSHVYMPTGKMIRQTADVWAFEGWNLGVRKVPSMK